MERGVTVGYQLCLSPSFLGGFQPRTGYARSKVRQLRHDGRRACLGRARPVRRTSSVPPRQVSVWYGHLETTVENSKNAQYEKDCSILRIGAAPRKLRRQRPDLQHTAPPDHGIVTGVTEWCSAAKVWRFPPNTVWKRPARRPRQTGRRSPYPDF